jgi:hypothetical protein
VSKDFHSSGVELDSHGLPMAPEGIEWATA